MKSLFLFVLALFIVQFSYAQWKLDSLGNYYLPSGTVAVGPSVATGFKFTVEGWGNLVNFSNLADQDINFLITPPGASDKYSLICPSTPGSLALGVGGYEKMRITNDGYVGIGTSTPNTHLQVNTTNQGSGTHDWIGANIGGATGDRVVIGLLYGTATIGAHNNGLNAWANLAMQVDGGNVGIGTINPGNYKLAINGSQQSLNFGSSSLNLEQQYVDFGGQNLVGASTLFKTNDGTNSWTLGAIGGVVGTPGNIANYPGGLAFFTKVADNNTTTAPLERMRIDANGWVGIGTAHPDQKLTVAGTIHSSEVTVDTKIPVPDYVFQPSYKLSDLPSVEEYVKKYHHLPEIPSAAEIEKDGLKLGEMNTLLLRKVEELTLYLIEKDKQATEQQKKINELEAKLNALIQTLDKH